MGVPSVVTAATWVIVVAWVWSLAQELPHATGLAKKKKGTSTLTVLSIRFFVSTCIHGRKKACTEMANSQQSWPPERWEKDQNWRGFVKGDFCFNYNALLFFIGKLTYDTHTHTHTHTHTQTLYGCIRGMWKFPGQGLNPSHSCDLHCSCGNTRSFIIIIILSF